MIIEKITADTSEEFLKIRTELETYLSNDFDINEGKQFLSKHVPNEVFIKAEILLETLINYLMGSASIILKDADVDTKNLFYEEDFRNQIAGWFHNIENKLNLNPSTAEFSKDTRCFNGMIAGSIAFVTGTAIAVMTFDKESVMRTIVTGILTLILSAVSYKVVFTKSDNTARETIKQDIENFLKISESQTKEWLKKVIKSFSENFELFCSKNNFEYKGKLK